MTRTRQLIIAFWIFIVIMLGWQFYSYDAGLTQAAKDNSTQGNNVFLHYTGPPAATPSAAQPEGPDVRQIKYTVENNVPENGSFTVHVTLKNVGTAKAVGVQIHVRPYRGMRLGDEDVGNSTLSILPDDDPLSQYGSWVSFPDLAPGEASTQSVVFLSHDGATPVVLGVSDTGVPGKALEKLTPEIIFSKEKAQ